MLCRNTNLAADAGDDATERCLSFAARAGGILGMRGRNRSHGNGGKNDPESGCQKREGRNNAAGESDHPVRIGGF